jgi:hypothetical protein
MAVKVFRSNVIRVHVDATGKILIRLRSGQLPQGKDAWFSVPFGAPGANSFLAIALTCVTSGLPAETGINEPITEYSQLMRIEIVQA